jgi:hypothetical protein
VRWLRRLDPTDWISVSERRDPGWCKQGAASQMTEIVCHPIPENRLRDEDQLPIHETGILQLLSKNPVHSERELTRDLLCIVFLR